MRDCEEVHHARYSDRDGAIAGREIPLVDVFPLCNECHDTYHFTNGYWIEDDEDPVLLNRNSPVAYWNLRMNAQLLKTVQRLLPKGENQNG